MRIIDLKNGKEIFEGFIVDNITIKDIEFDEEKFNNLIVDDLTRDDLFNLVLAYRKQLEAKEQECEELKENLSDLKKDLKFQNDKISEIELELQNANNTIENLDLMRVGEYNTLVDDYNKLKQTLTDIKKIAEEQQSWNEWNSKHSETENEDDIFAYNWSALKQILQKINECEINNEC